MIILNFIKLFVLLSSLKLSFSQNIDIADILRIFNIHEKILAKNVTLKTTFGEVTGVHRQVDLDRHIGISPLAEKIETEAFYGIPFGIAPGMFEKPVDYEKWEEPRDCTERSQNYQCYQSSGGSVNDCLRVSIQRPLKNKEEKKALMVWIHGGSYVTGSADGFTALASNNYLYDPVALVAKGDVIVASVNYRLDALGFFDNMELPGTEHLNGNYALYDLVKAIDWLIENADEIGFDKNRITVFGQSAGGSLTSWAASLSALQGKVKRIIPVSGQVSMFFGSHKFSGSNTAAANELASKNHCMYPHSEDMIECMRNKPADEINHMVSHTNISWRPSNDGDLVQFNDGIEQFRLFSKDIDVMVGHTSGDAVIFAFPYQGKSGLYKAMTDFAPDISPWPENEYLYEVELGVHWTRQFHAPTKDLSYTRGVIDALNKMLFGRGVVGLAKEHNELGGNGKTFVYRYDIKSILASLSDNIGPDPLPDCGDEIEHNGKIEETCGAIHGEDILYFMGKMELKKSELVNFIGIFDDTITDGRLSLSGRSVEAFSNFAKYGDPNGERSSLNPLYPEFNPEDPKLLSYRDADGRGTVDKQMNIDVYDFYDYYDGLEEVTQIRIRECNGETSATVTSDLKPTVSYKKLSLFDVLENNISHLSI